MKYGFFHYKSQKLDGPFEGYIVFAKGWRESWKDAFQKAIKKLEDNDDRFSKPAIINFFTKL